MEPGLVHPDSEEGVIDNLDLFSVPMTPRQLDRGNYVYYQPFNSSIRTDTIEFNIPAISGEYIDLQKIYLEIGGKMVNYDSGVPVAITNAEEFSVVNNFMHSLFKKVSIKLNDCELSNIGENYAFKAYLEKFLNCSAVTKLYNLLNCLWVNDTEGSYDKITAANAAIATRKAYFKESKQVYMTDRLHIELFGQGRYLLDDVNMVIKLIRSTPAFYLLREKANTSKSLQFEIEHCLLKVRRIKPKANVLMAHSALLRNDVAKYPINYVLCKSKNIQSGSTQFTFENLFHGKIPNRMIIGFIKTTAMEGNEKENPFYFEHNSLNYLCLYVNGTQIPGRPYYPDFDTGKYHDCYQDLMECIGMLNTNESNGLSLKAYGAGATLFGFDLTTDLSAGAEHFQLIKSGSLQLEGRFSSALTNNVSLFIYAESSQLIQIDGDRRVFTYYTL